jgi:hypothetical protein
MRVNISRSLQVFLSTSGSGNSQTFTGLFPALPLVSQLDLSFGRDQSLAQLTSFGFDIGRV